MGTIEGKSSKGCPRKRLKNAVERDMLEMRGWKTSVPVDYRETWWVNIEDTTRTSRICVADVVEIKVECRKTKRKQMIIFKNLSRRDWAEEVMITARINNARNMIGTLNQILWQRDKEKKCLYTKQLRKAHRSKDVKFDMENLQKDGE